VHLHLGVEVAHPHRLLLLLLRAVLLHLPDGVQEEQNQYRHQNIKIINELTLKPSEEPGLEDFVPHPGGDEWDEEKQDDPYLCVEEPRYQGPVDAHGAAL